MKIYEKIGDKGESKQEVYDYLYGCKVTPCMIGNEYLKEDKIDDICCKCHGDCEKCLDKFLDLEVENDE